MSASSTSHVSLNHAVVIGGSMAGLAAARVLLNHFSHVTLIERDRLPRCPDLRPGIPQASHVHILLVAGYRQLERLFPGITGDLQESGAIPIEWTKDWPILGIPGWFPRCPSELKGYSCSRILLETLVRRHLERNSRLRVMDGCQVEALVMDQTQKAIAGVKIQHLTADPSLTTHSTIDADFVVDASGRSSKLPDWLAALGYPTPAETKINAFWGYASCWYKRPSLAADVDWKGITIGPKPGESSRAGIIYPIEGNRWIVTLTGVGKDYPSTNGREFLEFARSLRDPVIYDAIKDAEPVSPIYSHRGTENRLRHYEKLSRFPDGLVALGDSVCAFNPVYGQGMTIAALATDLLDQELGNAIYHQHHLNGFSAQFQRKVAQLVHIPWLLATGEDSRYPMTVGSSQRWPTRLIQGYVDQVITRGLDHPDIFRTFAEVLHMVKPASALFHPSILRTVIAEFGRSPRHGRQSPFMSIARSLDPKQSALR